LIHRYYIAAVNGGIWRTDDAGRTWAPIFDNQSTQSIGALAVAPSDPNVVYAGSGEGLQRPDLSIGNGIYKSTDAGTTWTHLGLRDGQQIPQIAVDPKDPNRLFVAVLGHPYGPNSERGVYRSLDGGATFARVLWRNENTGAFDVKIDPHNPQIVYASLWAARQAPWEIGGSFEIGGSGIFKSTDGGNTWAPLRNGFPPRIGRAALALAPSDSNVIYASVDAPSGCGTYRSDDAGQHFTLVNHEDRICERGADLTSVAVDPEDSRTVYVTNTSTYRSTDGGSTFTAIKGAPGGDDYQNIWINPLQRDIILLVSDQGATLSLDRGATWSSWYNQPTAQMYHVSADDRFPYWVCSAQQESGSACVKSRGAWGETTVRDWTTVGAEEYGYIAPDPLHPGVFYGGKLQRYDERTTQSQDVSPNPLRSKGFRVVRTEPVLFDPLDKHTLYFGANQLYATRDGGMHWRTISPDLTRPHPGVPTVLGTFEKDDPQKGEHRGVIYSVAASYTHHGTIWAGTDDGLVWITRDGGAHWKNVTPPALTPWSKISQIDASHFDDNTAYLSVNRFRLDDLHPYVYRTHDGGAHWASIANGLPQEPVNAVRVDPQQRNLLFTATETGVDVSFNDGASWESLQLNLPRTSARDVIVHGNDLIVGTHGRGFWILDDIAPLRELARNGSPGTHLFTPSIALRVRNNTNTDTPLPPEEPHGQNPPDGAILYYNLDAPARKVTVTILDGSHRVVRRYASDDPKPAPLENLDKPLYWERPFTTLSTDPGMHRWVWDLREPSPESVTPDLPMQAVYRDTPRTPQGAIVVPGTYTVQLNVDGRVQQKSLSVRMDPRVSMPAVALAEQYAMAHDLAVLTSRTYAAMQQARAKKNDKAADNLATVNGRLSSFIEAIDGVDSPVPEGTRNGYCILRSQALTALGTMPARTAICK
jgi:photosystem II stability/assembly factor-like uncharacterized protein